MRKDPSHHPHDRTEDWLHRERMRKEQDPWSRRPGWSLLILLLIFVGLMLMALGLSVLLPECGSGGGDNSPVALI